MSQIRHNLIIDVHLEWTVSHVTADDSVFVGIHGLI